MSNELRSASFRSRENANFGQVQFLVFWDYAHVGSKNFVPGAINTLNACSVGTGLRYNLRSNVTATMDYGRQLIHLPNGDGKD